jgi:hypothetical protein
MAVHIHIMDTVPYGYVADIVLCTKNCLWCLSMCLNEAKGERRKYIYLTVRRNPVPHACKKLLSPTEKANATHPDNKVAIFPDIWGNNR